MSLLASFLPTLNRAQNNRDNSTEHSPSVRPVHELRENADAWSVTVYVPGVEKSGITITDENDALTIRAEKSFKQPAGWTSLYRETGDLPYELVLRHDNGFDAEKVQAELKDGILRLSLPKVEARKPRKINIA